MIMWEALERLLSGRFMPHGHCYLWSPEMVWLQVVSNLLIGGAYVAISSTLYLIIRRIKDLPFSWMYFAFGIFIITCGGTHFLDVVTIWHPVYWLDGGLRAITAVASVGTAALLVWLVPKAIGLAGAAQVAHERGEKLEEMYLELADAHAKRKELTRLKNQLYANVSHELRTPLTLVLGPTERLLRSPTTTDVDRQDLELVARNARTLLKYVNDLLDVAKLEAGKVEVDYARADAREVVIEAARHFEGLAAEQQIALKVDAPEPVPVELDADKIERVIINLLSNAFKHTPTSGVIRCAVSAAGGRVRIEIADSGPGIAAELRDSMFERFVQGDDEARRTGGTGLGLAIAKEFSELHGGSIRVEAAAEGGAAFVIELPQEAPAGSTVSDRPRTAADAGKKASLLFSATTAAAAPLPAPIDDGTGLLTRATVLVVEDNRDMNTLVSQTLATTYLVERAYDGEEGIAKARSLRPDLIITDLMMPRKSGDELVRAVRLDRQLDRVPIVLLTARTDEEVRAKVMAEGAQDYLTKPFTSDELLTRVGNLITMARLRAAHLRAAEASKLKNDFLGLVSHELRTPLTAMQLLMDRLVDADSHPLPAREKQIVDRLASATGRLTGLVDTLLHYARIQSGHLTLDVEPFDLGALAAEALEEVRPQARGKSLELIAKIDQRVRIETDPKLVRLVLVNLVSNAVKFTDHGSVTVSVHNDGDRRIVRITDTGPGIARDAQKRIFEPFQQLEPTKHKHLPGVGLGLSLVRQIVDNLKAIVVVHSEVGIGSTFEVSMPASHPDARRSHEVPAT